MAIKHKRVGQRLLKPNGSKKVKLVPGASVGDDDEVELDTPKLTAPEWFYRGALEQLDHGRLLELYREAGARGADESSGYDVIRTLVSTPGFRFIDVLRRVEE